MQEVQDMQDKHYTGDARHAGGNGQDNHYAEDARHAGDARFAG